MTQKGYTEFMVGKEFRVRKKFTVQKKKSNHSEPHRVHASHRMQQLRQGNMVVFHVGRVLHSNHLYYRSFTHFWRGLSRNH